MRISLQIALTLTLSGLLFFGSYASWLVRQEERDLRAAFQRETSLLGRSLHVALENALRDNQIEDIQETLDVLERIDPSVDVLVFDASGQLKAESTDSDRAILLSMPALSSPTTGWARSGSLLRWDESLPHGHLVMAWALDQDDGTGAGTLVVARPLTRLRADLRATRRAALLTIASFMVVTVLLGLLLGHTYVRRPLSRIVRAMAALRSHGTTELLPTPRNEIGAVASEFNALVGALREANVRLTAETEARLSLQQGLRRVDKLITIGQVSAGLAHEIGSPLQILNGRARALLDAVHDPVRVRKNAGILVAQTDRITRIVEQLLAFARRRPAVLSDVDVATNVAAVVDLLDVEARRRRVQLLCRSQPELPRIIADADQIQQVLLNLVSNALAATQSGGTISVDVSRPDGAAVVRIRVEDTGRGMDENVQAKLFQPFFTTRLNEGGTGLGLAIVKSIVDEHGGTISLESRTGHGTVFLVDLPVQGPPTERALAS